MTQTFSLAPVPFWYFPDETGKPLGGGKMFTYSSLDPNPTEYKPVFQDIGGTIPWTQPILFDLNGTQGPFYWEFDTTKPEEFYFIRILDSNDNLVYEINNYPGPGNGGGGTITTNINLKNYLANNIFLYNTGVEQIDNSYLINTTGSASLTIAPGAHSQFYFSDINWFNATPGATDFIRFIPFTLGSTQLTGDVQPYYYLNYTSNSVGGGSKGIQFPINPRVNTLEDQPMSFTIWGQTVGVGANTIEIWIRQYFGTGGSPSPDNELKVGSIPLTAFWNKYKVSFVVPNVAPFTLGNTGDDGTYIQIRFPSSASSNINIAKPSLYTGSTVPASDFETNEQIETQLETPRTGDLRISSVLPSFTPSGWIYLIDLITIGNVGSGANRANVDTWFLYNKLWLSVSNVFCPVSGGRGANPQSDWNAGKTLQLPLTSNRVAANAFGSHTLASFVGVDSSNIALGEIPDHTHIGPNDTFSYLTNDGGKNVSAGALQGGTHFNTGHISGYPAGQTARSNLQPTIYFTYIMKL